jgi:hypothetical protein
LSKLALVDEVCAQTFVVCHWNGDFGLAHAPSTLDTPIWHMFKKVFPFYRHLTVIDVGMKVRDVA